VLTRRQAFLPWIERGALDIVQPDATKCGGLSEARRIAWHAYDHNVQFVSHGWNTAVGLAADLHLAAALPVARYVEFLTPAPYIEQILTRPFQLDGDGLLTIPEAPDWGSRSIAQRSPGSRAAGAPEPSMTGCVRLGPVAATRALRTNLGTGGRISQPAACSWTDGRIRRAAAGGAQQWLLTLAAVSAREYHARRDVGDAPLQAAQQEARRAHSRLRRDVVEGLVAVIALATVMMLSSDDPLRTKPPLIVYGTGVRRFAAVLGVPPKLGFPSFTACPRFDNRTTEPCWPRALSGTRLVQRVQQAGKRDVDPLGAVTQLVIELLEVLSTRKREASSTRIVCGRREALGSARFQVGVYEVRSDPAAPTAAPGGQPRGVLGADGPGGRPRPDCRPSMLVRAA